MNLLGRARRRGAWSTGLLLILVILVVLAASWAPARLLL
jgi:hypothetical protein